MYSKAEESYRTLVSFFSEDPHLHLPVYVEKNQREFNAYFTSYPYNRIVVYDAPVSPSLDNSTDTIEMTFLHELTHAFTFSFKGGVGEAITSVFGDWANLPVSLHMLYYMQEGISVYTESRDGGGRLNDPFALSPLLEAKIEGKDISYEDASGGRDLFPGGNMWYIYGGAFSEWMAEKYGEKDLANYYRKIAEELFSFPQNAYSSIFSTTLAKDWRRFIQEIKVPEYLEEGERVASSSRVYCSLVSWNDSIYALSSSEEALLRIDGDGNVDKIMSYYSPVSDLSISKEGEFLLPSVFEGVERMEKYGKDGKLDQRYKGFSDGTFFLDGLLLFTTKDTVSYLIYIDGNGGETEIPLGSGVVAHEFVPVSDGAAFLITRDGQENIAYVSSSLSVSLFDTPSDMLFSSLSSSGDVLSFSWARKGGRGEMGKYGELDLSDSRLSLSEVEFIGGVNYPARQGDTVYFVSSRFDHSRIEKTAIESFSLEDKGTVALIGYEGRKAEDLSLFNKMAKKYNPLSTMSKGALLPFSYYTGSFLPDKPSLGLSWITMDATEETDLFLSGGFVSSISSYTFSTRVRKGSFGATLSATSGRGHFSYEANLGLSLSFPLSHSGEKIEAKDTVGWVSLDGEGEWMNYFSLQYSDIRHKGIGRYNNFGSSICFEMLGPSPSLTLALSFPGPIPRDVLSSVDYSLPSSIVLHLDKESLSGEEKIHLLDVEIQEGVRLLSLYFRNLEVYCSAREIYNFRYNTLHWEAGLGMKVVLSPILGSLSRNYVEIGVELEYNVESGIRPSLVLGAEI
ncbi:MAG: hypothetical protein ACI4S4_07735 [Candidatus Ornithospirochaeta sp.]